MTRHAASLGLSIGATNIVGTHGSQTVVHPAVLRTTSGAWLGGFVDRIGDPVPLIAADGSAHQPEALLAEALRTVAYAVSGDAPVTAAVTVPAHWPTTSVDCLRHAMGGPLYAATIVTDASAAMAALQAEPGLPTDGVVVLCDIGGSGTSITLFDARDAQPITTTVRTPEFGGDLVDQAIMAQMLAGTAATDPFGTAVVSSLTRLREACRLAKHRLSQETATGIDLPHGTVRLTRGELDTMVDGPLTELLAVIDDAVRGAGVTRVSAVALTGGGARMPLITERLSAHLRVPVIVSAQPQLTAAHGAALLVQRSRTVETPTVVAAPAQGAAALAWSVDSDEVFEPMTVLTGISASRPDLVFDEFDEEEPVVSRGPLVAFAVAAAAALTMLAAYGLTAFDSRVPTPTSAAATVTVSSSVAPGFESPPVTESAAVVPVVDTVTSEPAYRPPRISAPQVPQQPPTVTQTTTAPPVTTAVTTTTTVPQSTTPTTTEPTTTTPTTTEPTTTTPTTLSEPPTLTPPTFTVPPTFTLPPTLTLPPPTFTLPPNFQDVPLDTN